MSGIFALLPGLGVIGYRPEVVGCGRLGRLRRAFIACFPLESQILVKALFRSVWRPFHPET
jgi:hypothetical protein